MSAKKLVVSLMLVAAVVGSNVYAQSPAVTKLLERIKAADTDLLAVSEEDGRFLRVMVVTSGATHALEIGGANGYSAIWIGLGLRETGGHLTTIEYDPGARQGGRREHPPSRPRRHRHRRAGRCVQGDPEARRRVRLRVSRRLEARLQALLRSGAAAPSPRGLFLAHNVVNKQAEMRDFLAAIRQ